VKVLHDDKDNYFKQPQKLIFQLKFPFPVTFPAHVTHHRSCHVILLLTYILIHSTIAICSNVSMQFSAPTQTFFYNLAFQPSVRPPHPAPQIRRASRWHCALYKFTYLLCNREWCVADLFTVAGFLLSASDGVERRYEVVGTVGEVETWCDGGFMKIHLIRILKARTPEQSHVIHSDQQFSSEFDNEGHKPWWPKT